MSIQAQLAIDPDLLGAVLRDERTRKDLHRGVLSGQAADPDIHRDPDPDPEPDIQREPDEDPDIHRDPDEADEPEGSTARG